MAPVYEAYYEDDLGNERELMGIAADSLEEAREQAPLSIAQRFGQAEADKWKLYGSKLRAPRMESSNSGRVEDQRW